MKNMVYTTCNRQSFSTAMNYYKWVSNVGRKTLLIECLLLAHVCLPPSLIQGLPACGDMGCYTADTRVVLVLVFKRYTLLGTKYYTQ